MVLGLGTLEPVVLVCGGDHLKLYIACVVMVMLPAVDNGGATGNIGIPKY